MRLVIISCLFITTAMAFGIHVDLDYMCFTKVMGEVTMESCPEVRYAGKKYSGTKKYMPEILRHTAACYKRHYLNKGCEISQWERMCIKSIDEFPEELNDKAMLNLAKIYCTY